MAHLRHAVFGAITFAGSPPAAPGDNRQPRSVAQTDPLEHYHAVSAQIIATGPLPLPFPIPASTGVNSAAMGLWLPTQFDNCTHGRFHVMPTPRRRARLRKWYPTWHPPTDPITGCYLSADERTG